MRGRQCCHLCRLYWKLRIVKWVSQRCGRRVRYASSHRNGALHLLIRGNAFRITCLQFDRLATEMMRRLIASPAKRTIIHVFSNGGGTLWAALSERLHAQGQPCPVTFAAVVFDSCPGSWRSLSSGIHFLLATQRSPLSRGCVLASIPLLTIAALLGWLASLRYAGGRITDAHARYIDSISLYARATHHRSVPAPLPVVFLYSADDKLIPSSVVEGMIERLAACDGVEVSSQRWARSPHVQHMRTDPEGYRRMLSGLLSRL